MKPKCDCRTWQYRAKPAMQEGVTTRAMPVHLRCNSASGSAEYPCFADSKIVYSDFQEKCQNIAKATVEKFDSDTSLLTDNKILVNAAQRNYKKFLIPTKLVGAKKIDRVYSPEQQADLDIKTAINKIGEIVNLSQELNTLMWDNINRGKNLDTVDDIYLEVAKLDVMSNIEIDSAKREYATNSAKEIERIKDKYCRRDAKNRLIKPNFFAPVAKSKGYYDTSKKQYKAHETSMDYLQKHVRLSRKSRQKHKFIPFVDILNPEFCNAAKTDYRQVKRIMSLVEDTNREIKEIWSSDDDNITKQQKHLMACEARQKCVEYISKIKLSNYTIYMLLTTIEDERYRKLSRNIFSILFGAPNKSFFAAIDASAEHVPNLVESRDGDIRIHDCYFVRE